MAWTMSGIMAPLLIALGIGYLVLYFAKREEKNLQILGYFLGTLIILYSIIFIVLTLLMPPVRHFMPRRMLMQGPKQEQQSSIYNPAPMQSAK